MSKHAAFAQEELRDHYKFPRNKKTIEPSDFNSSQLNRSCGDVVTITGTVVDGVIAEIGFEGSGCIISQAVASMLTEKVIGMTPNQVAAITQEEIATLVGIPLGPNRLKCALLALTVLKKALQN